jgi:MGT family glycosyltransferase
MARFLFVTWYGGGNVNPTVALAAQLLRRGHDVHALGPTELRARFESERIAFQAHRTRDEYIGARFDFATATVEQHDACFRGLADDVIAEAARVQPDVLVVDFMQPEVLCAGERTAVPVAALVHTLYAWGSDPERSPMRMFGPVQRMNVLRDALGLSHIEQTTDLLDRTSLVLALTVPEFDDWPPSKRIPANARYAGPIVEEAGPDGGWAPPAGDGPLVVVSLGTTSMDEAPVLQRVLDAVADLPVRAIATVGDHLNPADFKSPTNATVSTYIRHAALLPHAALFVTHAGLSGIGAALTYGVPMLCLPLGRDQPTNARRVEATGCGRVLAPEAATDELRTSISELVDDAAARASSARMADVVSAYGNGARAVAHLEELADG